MDQLQVVHFPSQLPEARLEASGLKPGLVGKLPQEALARIEAGTAAFLADYLPKLEREANKNPIRDAELLRELVVYRYNLVARECLAVSSSADEFERQLWGEIVGSVRLGLSKYPWLANGVMREELDAGFTFFTMRVNPREIIADSDQTATWHVGAITGAALSELSLKLRAEARKRAAEGGCGKPASSDESAGKHPAPATESAGERRHDRHPADAAPVRRPDPAAAQNPTPAETAIAKGPAQAGDPARLAAIPAHGIAEGATIDDPSSQPDAARYGGGVAESGAEDAGTGAAEGLQDTRDADAPQGPSSASPIPLPEFSLETLVQIERCQSRLQEKFLSTSNWSEFSMIRLGLAPCVLPPGRPMQLKQKLREHADAMFDCEAKHCPNGKAHEQWFLDLAKKLQLEIIFDYIQVRMTAVHFGLTQQEASEFLRQTLEDRAKWWIRSKAGGSTVPDAGCLPAAGPAPDPKQPGRVDAAPAQPASFANAETRPTTDPHRGVPTDSGPQAVEERGSSDKPGTTPATPDATDAIEVARLRSLSIEREDAAINEAIEILKNQPGWDRSQELVSRANVWLANESKRAQVPEARRTLALKNLNRQARIFLGLVSSRDSADAVSVLLLLLVRNVYLQVFGVPPQRVVSLSKEGCEFAEEIELRRRKLMAAVYRKAARVSTENTAKTGRNSRMPVTSYGPEAPSTADGTPVPAETELPTQRKGTPTEVPDLDERKTAYDAYKRKCKDAGVKMTERKLAQLANRAWNTRDPVMKWKQGKDRPGDDRLIRRAMEKVPSASQL